MPSADDLRREIVRTNAARAAARRLVALRRPVPRVAGAEVFPLLVAFWEMDPDRYAEMVSEAATRIAARPPLAGPRVLLTGAPVDAHTLHEVIESHGAVVVDEVGPWGSGAAGDDVRIDDDPVAALADKYRVDSIGARTPVDALRGLTHSRLAEVDAVVVSLPPDDAVFGWDYPALRDVLQARRIPHICLRCDPYDTPTPADHAALDAMVSAVSRLQEARHG
jgi:benzoyl-CoA reductase/2-hydroxyglutaryl-CoA dehydratase subunit BcrC/BadD/HgdB